MEAVIFPPLSAEEIDLITNISVASFIVGAIAILIFLICMLLVAYKTKLPGRYLTLFSAILLLLFFGYTHYMGGNLEYVFGSEGLLYETIAHSLIVTTFSIGFVRMCLSFTKG